MSEKKTAQLLIRMSPSLKKALSIAAEKDSRTMASLIEKLIKDHLESVNISWTDD